MPIYLDEDMQGVCEVCGSKAKRRCNDCQATFFCNRACQRELRDTHKKECKIEAAIARCLDANTKDPYILECRRRRPPDGATCLICLEGAGDSDETLFHQGCACRGTAGYAHVRCVFEHALQRDSVNFQMCITCNVTAWHFVFHSRVIDSLPKSHCLLAPTLSLLIEHSSLTFLGVGKQMYSGEFVLRLSAACWRRFRRIDALNPTTTQEQLNWWLDSNNLLSRVLVYCACFEESLILHREALAVARTAYGPDSTDVLSQLSKLAETLSLSGKVSEARDLLAPHALTWRSLTDPAVRNMGLGLCRVLATSHIQLGEHARAEVLLKLVIDDIAQRPGDEVSGLGLHSMELLVHNLQYRGKYEEALNLVNDLLEKLTRIYGSEHPHVQDIRKERTEISLQASSSRPLPEEESLKLS